MLVGRSAHCEEEHLPDPSGTRADPKAPLPQPEEFKAVQDLFQRLLTGREAYRTLAVWLNRRGFTTRNRRRSAAEDRDMGRPANPHKFTEDSVRSIVTNPFRFALALSGERVDFRTGQVLELLPKSGFRYVLEAAQIIRPLGGSGLTSGDPEGIRGASE